MKLSRTSLAILIASLALLVVIAVLLQSKIRPSGEKLAHKYCAMCHEFPAPDQLTKQSWTYLLTYMGLRLGIRDYSYMEKSHPHAINNMRSKEAAMAAAEAIPNQPMVTEKEWAAIRKYYDDNAPEKPLTPENKQAVREDLRLFRVKPSSFDPRGAVNTYVKIDTAHNRIIVSDSRDQSINFLDKNLNLIKKHIGYEVIVDTEQEGDSLYLLSIGDLMGRYVGQGKGFIYLSLEQNGDLRRYTTVARNLLRPADMEFADFNNDGTREIVIANFGDVTGNVSIFGKREGGYALQQEIINVAGAVKCATHDFDKDGLLDIAVLFGDAKENLSIFFNKGDAGWERKIVIEGNQAFGYTSFELKDFNKDGAMDIVTVNGDSDADPYNTLKRYHGIRIYLNDAHSNFTEKYFYPMYGVHFARAADYDQDGDLDLAAVSFFPDFDLERPENFTYLQNNGDMTFEPFTLPATYEGRWMIMDIGDADGDKDIDIILGAGYIPLGMVVNYEEKFENMVAKGKAIMFLENTLH